jgi:hypothetical protein
MRKVIDFFITAVAYMIVVSTLNSVGVEWHEWQFWIIVLSMALFAFYNYADGLYGWSRGPHKQTP